MKLMKFTLVIFSIAAIMVLVGCSDEVPSGLPQTGLGNVPVTKYVSIGNSLTAGYQSGALYEEAQRFSYPILIAQQLTIAGANLGKFEQPIWGDPGSPDATGKAGRYEIINLNGPIIGPIGLPAGPPSNLSLSRPYDNLGIPGAVLYDFLDSTGASTNFISKAVARGNPFFPHVLRAATFGNSIFNQLKNITPKPDVITFWLGNNDVLGFATSGGTSVSPFTGQATPTPTATFTSMYAQAMDSLRTAFPNAKILVANIPDVKAIPYFTTVGALVKPNLTAFPLSYQKHGTTGAGNGITFLNENNPPLLTLTASTYALLIGQRTGKYYKDNNLSVPPGIDTTALFGIEPTNPFPDALILDSLEQKMAYDATVSFNQSINQIAISKSASVVDVFSIFNNIKANVLNIAGEIFSTEYVTGGLFSLDGVHPSSRGAGIVANEFIKAMNSSFGMNVPFVNISSLPGIPAPLSKYANGKFFPHVTRQAGKNQQDLWK